MGSDDCFRRRKARSVAELERERRNRAEGERFLIICEGEKTEPFYFLGLCKKHRLTSVAIEPSVNGSAPDQVLEYAEKLFEKDKKCGLDGYDKVFCVIDRDMHSTFDSTMLRISKLREQGKPFHAIPSYPCFEYWLLLHFIYTRKPCVVKGKHSACDRVIAELRRQKGFSRYNKAMRNVFLLLEDKISIAINHAKRAEIDADKTVERNPSTCVHQLVEELLALAGKKLSAAKSDRRFRR